MTVSIDNPPESTLLAQWTQQKLREIAVVVDALEQGGRIVFHEAPPRPRTGMTVYADGTDWNPGSGEGMYEYRSDGLWYKL